MSELITMSADLEMSTGDVRIVGIRRNSYRNSGWPDSQGRSLALRGTSVPAHREVLHISEQRAATGGLVMDHDLDAEFLYHRRPSAGSLAWIRTAITARLSQVDALQAPRPCGGVSVPRLPC